MQITQKSETRLPIVFDTKLEVVPGGVTVAIADLNIANLTLYAGTPIGRDANNLYHVIKGAVAYANASNTDTSYQVKKGHNFKVGDFYSTGVGTKAYAITAIDTTTSTLYDTITVGTTLGVAVTAGDAFIQAKQQATGNTSVLNVEPSGYVGTHSDVVAGDNLLVDCVLRGSMRAAALTALGITLNATILAKTPLVRLSY